MANPHPTIALVFDVDEVFDEKETRLELKRCYNYISSSTSVRTHPTDPDVGMENTLRLLIKFGAREYLDSSAEGADALWTDVMELHLRNDLKKLGNNMQIFNRRQREEDLPEIYFDWLEVELGGGDLVVRFHLDSQSSVPEENALLLTNVRALYNKGTFGEGLKRVSIPAKTAYLEQKAAWEAQEEERARLAAEEEAARLAAEEEARQAAEEEAAESFLESPELEEELDEETKFHNEEARVHGEVVKKYTLAEPDFVLDTRVWGVEFDDGTEKLFDSEEGVMRGEGESEA